MVHYSYLHVLLFSWMYVTSASSSVKYYLEERENFVKNEEQYSINSVWKLTSEEENVEKLLQNLKSVDNKLDPIPTEFSFGSMETAIANSELFTLLSSTPKGALLHSHDVTSQHMSFYINASYLSGCMYNTDPEIYGILSFRPGLDELYVPISSIRNTW